MVYSVPTGQVVPTSGQVVVLSECSGVSTTDFYQLGGSVCIYGAIRIICITVIPPLPPPTPSLPPCPPLPSPPLPSPPLPSPYLGSQTSFGVTACCKRSVGKNRIYIHLGTKCAWTTLTDFCWKFVGTIGTTCPSR